MTEALTASVAGDSELNRVKVERVETRVVSVPRTEAFTTSLGTHRRGNATVLRIWTDNGLAGAGEVSFVWHPEGAGLRHVVDAIGRRIEGQSIADATRTVRSLAGNARREPALAAIAAVESALLDLIGKIQDRPIHTLFGGPRRPSVELAISLPFGDPSTTCDRVRKLLAAGCATVKIKIGTCSGRNAAVLSALRSEFGSNVSIRVDANMAWTSLEEALPALRKLERFDLLSIEQPLQATDLEGSARLRRALGVPIVLDESVWTMSDAILAVREEAADIVNIYVAEAGGIVPAIELGTFLSEEGVGVCVGSMPEMGVGTAACRQLAFALPHVDHPCDLDGARYYVDNLIVEMLDDTRDGHILPPSRAGLGVSLDEVAVAAYEVT